MNCLQFRQLSVTEPGNHDKDFLEHQISCQHCQAFARDIRKFDEQLENAIKIPVPDDLVSRILNGKAMIMRSRRNIWKQVIPAIAASIIFITGLTTGLLYHSPPSQTGIEQALETYVNNHRDNHLTTQTVSHTDVSETLLPFGIEITGDLGTVNYAAPCYIRNKMAVHLVLAGERGPVITLFMPDEQLQSKQTFRFGQYMGIIVPCPKGSMAIIGVFGEPLADRESRIRKSVTWL